MNGYGTTADGAKRPFKENHPARSVKLVDPALKWISRPTDEKDEKAHELPKMSGLVP
jgi:hypothetical protein